MSFSVTVVHAPDAVPADHWEALRRRAPGAYDHELRLVLDDPGDGLDGHQLDDLLHRFLGAPGVQLSTAGVPLGQLRAGSVLLHPAMVVLISSAERAVSSLAPAQLNLCLDSGPDAGRLIPLRRGRTRIGRGPVTVSAADPLMSRHESALELGSSAVLLHRHHRTPAAAESLTTEQTFHLGSTQCRLSLDPPAARPAQSWPTPVEPVGAKPPERSNKMMLAFALVPLVAGIVLVIVTGMWFFLLFSGASAVIASVIFWDGRRRRRKYRRHIRQAALRWGQRTAATLGSPGDLVRQLRAQPDEQVFAGARTDEGPAVRVGTGTVAAQLDMGTESDQKYDDDAAASTAVGITLRPGEQTAVTGPLREARQLLRWITVQLALNPLRPQTVLLGDSAVAELRDYAQVTEMAPAEFHTVLDSPGQDCGKSKVLILTGPDDQGCVQRAVSAGWHVLSTSPPTQRSGWRIDLEAHRVAHDDGVTITENLTHDLNFEGLSALTLREHLRLGLAHGVSDAGPGEVPAACAHRLPEQMFTGSAATELVAALGRNESGAQNLDLIEDGPHVLIAGTSGSGKSELLKTMLTSLCARYGPDELGMVLIDFKGGAAFHRLSQLEHCLGMVTDLSQAAAERTLEGIRSELFRREKLFLESGAGDYAEYRQLAPQQALARIVVVIDEFRIFSHELPDQLDELMRLATLGRSLGLHLVLSTQRPQGVVTADIRANIGSSICLRVRSADESRDVIGSHLAADIPRTAPGRAALRLPGETPRLFQTAQLSGTGVAGFRPEASPAEPAVSAGFSSAVEAVRKAAADPKHRRTHTPLLPQLPQQLGTEDRLQSVPAATDCILVGRLDDPSHQQQEDLVLDLRYPQALLLLGEAGSGASEAAAAIAAQALEAGTTSDVYLLDGDRSLAALGGHPRVGSWLTEEDLPEAERLLQLLCDELAERRISTLRDTGSGDHRPLLIVVSGYAQWHAASYSGLQTLDHLLGTLAAEGPLVGISAVLTGGRELANGKLASRVPTRIYCPLGTSEEMRYLWPKLRSTDPVSGRGVLVSPHTPAPGTTVQLVAGTFTTDGRDAAPSSAPEIRVRPLPERISADQIVTEGEDTGPLVGVHQFSWSPATLPLGPVNLILGARGTGKTSCLQLLHQQVPESQLLSPGCALPETAPEVLLVDDATACSPEQHSYIQQAATNGVPVVAATAPSAAVFSRLPWAHPARSEGSNVLLSPTSRSQADAFTAFIPVLSRPVPGRAVHLRPEGPVFVQWAVPGVAARP